MAYQHTQRKSAEAEPLFRRALEISEVALGQDHPDVAKYLNSLAKLLRFQVLGIFIGTCRSFGGCPTERLQGSHVYCRFKVFEELRYVFSGFEGSI